METEDSQPPFLKLQLLAIFLIAVVAGIGDCFLGPSLADLELKYKVDTRQISILFPICTGAKLLGSLVYLRLQIYGNQYILMAGASLLAGVLIGVIPVVSSFWLAVIVVAGVGFIIGLLNNLGNVKGGQIAKHSILPYHLLTFGYTTGNITGPLMLFPFVDHHQVINNHTDYERHFDSNNTGCLFNATTNFNETCTNSKIGNGFLVITAFYTATGIGIAVLSIFFKNNKVTNTARIHSEHSYWQKGLATFAFISISLFFGFVGGTTNVVYANLLPTFGIHSTLRADPQTMALMTSSLSTVTLFGRLCGIVFSYAIPQICLFFFSLVGVLVSSVCLVFIGEKSLTDLWIGTSMFALFCAPVYGSLLTWTEQIVPLSSTYLIIMTFLDNGGLSVVSLIIGQLMTIYIPNMLHFSMVFVGCIQLLSFFIMFVLSKRISHYVSEYSELTSHD